MFEARQCQVRPDLIGDHHAVIRFIDFHGFLDLPFFPDTATGIVRAAENCHMDLICLQFCVHILIIHAPDVVFVETERTVNDLVAVACQASGKADVGRAVEQHVVPFGAQNVQRGDHAAQHAVFVADVFALQPGNAVMALLPADNGIVIFRGRV